MFGREATLTFYPTERHATRASASVLRLKSGTGCSPWRSVKRGPGSNMVCPCGYSTFRREKDEKTLGRESYCRELGSPYIPQNGTKVARTAVHVSPSTGSIPGQNVCYVYTTITALAVSVHLWTSAYGMHLTSA